MKFRHLLSMASLLLPFAASAVLADPAPFTVTNPDGTTLVLKNFGDAVFSYTTDEAGTTIYQYGEDGFWRPMRIEGKIAEHSYANIAQLRQQAMPFVNKMALQESNAAGQKRMAAIDSDERTTYPTIGDKRTLVILCEFADVPFSCADPKKEYSDMLNKPGYDAYLGKGSANDYFKDVSNGKFNPVFDVVGPVKLKYDLAHYTQPYYYNNQQTTRDRIYEIVYEAVTGVDSEVNFADYDLDNNQLIDNIFFYYSGHGAADMIPYVDPPTAEQALKQYIWPHQGDYRDYVKYSGALDPTQQLVVDGVVMATYACGNELKAYAPQGYEAPWRDGIGTFCHEYGHVLGLPDFYDTANTNQGTSSQVVTPGTADIMDSGSYNNFSTCPPGYNAYERWFCRWIELEDAQEASNNTLTPLTFGADQTCSAVKLVQYRLPNRPTSEYFIVEARGDEKWDSTFPHKGMVIWHVDFDNKNWQTNQVNSGKVASYNLMPSYKEGKIVNYNWPYISNLLSIDYSVPGSDNYLQPTNFAISQNWLTDMKYDYTAKTGSFNYNVITEVPTVTTTMKEPTRDLNNAHNLFIYWNSVPEATSYQLTVYRIDDRTGTKRTVDGCDERNVGLKTSYSIYGLSDAAWDENQTYYASVRVVNHIPSENKSEEIVFKIKDLVMAGVENVAVDMEAPVYGGYGCIVAPDNAQIYSLNGQRVANNNLPAGIYVVRANGKSYKVVVK